MTFSTEVRCLKLPTTTLPNIESDCTSNIWQWASRYIEQDEFRKCAKCVRKEGKEKKEICSDRHWRRARKSVQQWRTITVECEKVIYLNKPRKRYCYGSRFRVTLKVRRAMLRTRGWYIFILSIIHINSLACTRCVRRMYKIKRSYY